MMLQHDQCTIYTEHQMIDYSAWVWRMLTRDGKTGAPFSRETKFIGGAKGDREDEVVVPFELTSSRIDWQPHPRLVPNLSRKR